MTIVCNKSIVKLLGVGLGIFFTLGLTSGLVKAENQVEQQRLNSERQNQIRNQQCPTEQTIVHL